MGIIIVICIFLIVMNIFNAQCIIDPLEGTEYDRKVFRRILLIPPIGIIVYAILTIFFMCYWIYDTVRKIWD